MTQTPEEVNCIFLTLSVDLLDQGSQDYIQSMHKST